MLGISFLSNAMLLRGHIAGIYQTCEVSYQRKLNLVSMRVDDMRA